MPLNPLILMVVLLGTIPFGWQARGQSAPISLHPDNPHYLLWRGKPTVLITSGEHYGAVMNAPFDYVAYLDELQSVGLNKTRIFSGVYCEAPGDYGIKDNKNILAPDRGKLLCPYARSETPGYANGGNKFDLTRWDEAYFRRLKDFVAQAGRRGIVVEFTFFCPYYFDSQWNLSPFNVQNNVNINDIGAVSPTEIYTLNHPKLLRMQQALVQKVVTELKDADNVYYEILNEAYWNRTTLDRSLTNPADPYGQLLWQHKIAETIVEAEKDFANKHLVAQCSWPTFSEAGYGTPGKGWKLDKPHPAVSIFNFHNVPTPEVVGANYALNKAIAQDETCPTAKTTAFDYRRWAWAFLLAGGAIYDNLDYSFTVAQPKGEYKYWRWEPGETRDDHLDGVSAITRKQLRILKNFIEGFDFIRMKPDTAVVQGGVPAGGAAYVLANRGEAYAIYLHGGKQTTLMLDMPAGRYRAEWVNTFNGSTDKSEEVTHGGGALKLASPEYKEDVGLRVVLSKSTPIALHPANPHYLLWRGKPTVLITSGEHYGAVMNAPFDYVRYLDELQSLGLNLTRVFSGVYCEARGDFNIKDNNLAPGYGNLLCPYARSDAPGYANGGNKFNLNKWDETYFKRLKDFVAQAGRRGIVVEFSFFCPYYTASQWRLSPFNSQNNINSGEAPQISRENGLTHPQLLQVQQALVRKVVAELKGADNLYYEICNEAYGVPFPWQQQIAKAIVDAEAGFSYKHLIAQNTSPVYDAVHPAVSIFNFHPGAVNVSVQTNYGLNKLTGLDETSPRGNPLGASMTALEYRRWGWTLLLDGGAIYNNLDYSFTVEHPAGAYQQWDQQPGGTMAAMRKQLRGLKDFLESFDFVRMKPDATIVKGGVPPGGGVHALAKRGEAYAIYLYGGKQATLTLDVPAGRYRAEWLNTLNGKVDKSEEVTHGGGALTLGSPEYKDDVALRLVMVGDHAASIQDLRAGEYPGHWTGRFIWDQGEAAPPHCYLMLRKSFDLVAPATEARVHIAVADKYLLYLNGQYVGRGPCRSIGPKWISYDTHDVTTWLKPGTNTLAILAYFFGGAEPCSFSHFRRPGLFVQLEAALADGNRALIGSDASWKVRAASGYRRDTSVGNSSSQVPTEVYEAGRDPEDWMQAEYDDSSWVRAMRLPDADWQYLEPRVTPLPHEREVFPVKLVAVGEAEPADAARFKDTDVAERLTAEKHGPLAYCKAEKAAELIKADAGALFQSAEGRDPFVILDFGQPYLGIPRVVFEAPQGTVVEVTYAATRLVDGRVPAMECGRFGDRYVAREGLQTWQPFEFKKATRLLQIVFRTGGAPVRVHSVSLIAQEYPVRLRGSFACSDETLTRLWRATVDTVYLHLEDTYLNDPVRERSPYLLCGELEQSHLAYYAAYGDIAATDLNFQHTTRGQLPDGTLAWGTGQNYSFIPTFSLFYAQAVLNRHHYFAKPGFLQENYPALVRVEQWCQENANQDTELLDRLWPGPWLWLDWPNFSKWESLKRGEKTRTYFYVDALHCKMLEDMSAIAGRLGKPEDSARWQARAARIRESMRRLYWDPERRLYADLLTDGQRTQIFSELINGLALLYSIATPEQTVTIVSELTQPRADLTRVSPLYIYYVLEGLIKSGAAEYSYRYLSERYAPTLAASDFPTLWEGWSGETPVGANNTSTIHGGGAGVAWTLMTHVLGVTPLADGFKRVRIAPEPGALAWAKGTLPSAAGDISLSWRKLANDFQIEAILPEAVPGELVLPRPGPGRLRLVHNGVERSVPPLGHRADGVETGQRTVTLQILSGSHRVQLTAADNVSPQETSRATP